jgi:hypothetical protein
MKAAKIIRHSWEELTGLEELDSNEMEELRLMFNSMFADSPYMNRWHLQAFFEKHATYILSKPTSDMCVVLFRLLTPFAPSYLATVVLIGDIFMPSLGTTFTAAQFSTLVYESFAINKRPVPIVTGFRPVVSL